MTLAMSEQQSFEINLLRVFTPDYQFRISDIQNSSISISEYQKMHLSNFENSKMFRWVLFQRLHISKQT